jgi:hypothetical protein
MWPDYIQYRVGNAKSHAGKLQSNNPRTGYAGSNCGRRARYSDAEGGELCRPAVGYSEQSDRTEDDVNLSKFDTFQQRMDQ